MSYRDRFPPQGGRRGHLHRATDLPDIWAELAALLWSRGITAVADLREQPDPRLQQLVEDAGIAYGHIDRAHQRQRLGNAEQRYHTLILIDDDAEPDTDLPVETLG